jgi:predicted RNA binding protein YcfA (HicA-like mRNA interferase family)
MSRLPVCSGGEAVKAFRQVGYEVDHQTGNHIFCGILPNAGCPCRTIVNWPKELCAP